MPRPVNLAAYRLPPEKQQIVLDNIGLVRKVINDRFSVYSEYYNDMFQEGCIGLIKAVSKHDSSKGAQLSTFGYLCIKNEIQKFVSERTDTIKVPVSVGLAIENVRRIEERGGTAEERKQVLEHNQISEEMLKAGKTALLCVSMDDENEDGLPYKEVIAGPPIDILSTDNAEKKLYSDLHSWLIFQHPDELVEIRIYVNYIAKIYDRDRTISDVMNIITSEYQINRSTLRKISDKYKEEVKNYLKQLAN